MTKKMRDAQGKAISVGDVVLTNSFIPAKVVKMDDQKVLVRLANRNQMQLWYWPADLMRCSVSARGRVAFSIDPTVEMETLADV